MRKIILIVLLNLLITKTYSQMTKKTFYEIEFFILKEKDKKSILLSSKDFIQKKVKGDNIYELADGRIIYEMIGIEIYLFQNKEDFNYFEVKCEEIANESVKRKTEIKDLNFIEKRFLYIDFFKQAYNIDFKTSDLNSLIKLDDLLNTLKKEDVLKYRLSIIAIIGESIISNTKEGKWRNFQISKNVNIPAIFVQGSVIDPVEIFDNQIFTKSDKRNKISISNYLKKLIKSL
ncbi:hypothetical protein D0817_24565 [Flavobacterium cupreum]|uniref:Uncharacterized protein n=1 Tax=Flavobacterium cupreum TaxID=2133766 RepID=A0A434A0A7_9FLAO|nr:hypothetical protein [Flavobacterium cupreum]RUT67791.1 hypothetical protein D0817_24565 [Flavobacterium cupreum]